MVELSLIKSRVKPLATAKPSSDSFNSAMVNGVAYFTYVTNRLLIREAAKIYLKFGFAVLFLNKLIKINIRQSCCFK